MTRVRRADASHRRIVSSRGKPEGRDQRGRRAETGVRRVELDAPIPEPGGGDDRRARRTGGGRSVVHRELVHARRIKVHRPRRGLDVVGRPRRDRRQRDQNDRLRGAGRGGGTDCDTEAVVDDDLRSAQPDSVGLKQDGHPLDGRGRGRELVEVLLAFQKDGAGSHQPGRRGGGGRVERKGLVTGQ